MSYKYIGEAVALLGIAFAIMRWVMRTLGTSDARPSSFSHRETAHGVAPPVNSPAGDDRPSMQTAPETIVRESLASEPNRSAELRAAATMFGVLPDALARMDSRELLLLLEAYRAARSGARADGPPGEPAPS